MDLNDFRKLIIEGKSPTDDQLREAIQNIRAERLSSASRATTKRKVEKGLSDAELDQDLASLGL